MNTIKLKVGSKVPSAIYTDGDPGAPVCIVDTMGEIQGVDVNAGIARRLVACWNVFAILDIPTDVIEEVDGSETIIGKYVQACRERDALLAALVRLKEAVEFTPLGVRGIKAIEHTNTLIQHPAAGLRAPTEQSTPPRPSEGTESARRIIGEAPRITEADRIAADMAINDLKSSGELRRRDDDRALAEQVKHEVPK